MTWSIIARDNTTGQIGIAVATKFFAVGARVPHIAAGIGGIATQALVNPYYGIDGVKLLREGRLPHDIIATLIAADSGRESRQLHIMDATGLTSGTVYPALRRLEEAGYLTSKWEHPSISQAEPRPARKYYELTRTGRDALADALKRYRILEQPKLKKVRVPKPSRA